MIEEIDSDGSGTVDFEGKTIFKFFNTPEIISNLNFIQFSRIPWSHDRRLNKSNKAKAIDGGLYNSLTCES